jgi:heat shock protein HslJ/uncharacterized lipoprotein YbaY
MFRLAAILAVLMLPLVASAQGYRSLSGTVTYRERIALPSEATVLVEMVGPDLSLIAGALIATEGRQVPIPFSIDIPEGAEGHLRAGLMLDGRVAWLSEAVQIAVEAPGDLGELVVRPYRPMGFASTWRCGDRLFRVGFVGAALVLDTGGAYVTLAPVPAASGARYEMDGTVFWDHGAAARVTLDGMDLPECRPALPIGTEPYRAGGNEPFWSLTLAEGEMRLVRLGLEDLNLPVTDSALSFDGTIEVISGSAASLPPSADVAVLARHPAICRDTMTGMPYPETVELTVNQETLTGCGGAPADLLTGRTWVVEDIAGAGIIDASRMTLGFGTDGRVAGSGGCNRWFAGYTLTGEGLSIGQAGSTMMACPEALMDQERRFFEALGQVTGFDIDDGGALVLMAAGQPILTARVATDGSAP